MTFLSRWAFALFVLLWAMPLAAASVLPSAPVTSIFHIAKSENRNQVHYAVSVDERCRPRGNAPLRGYWRELEEGPDVIEALKEHQHRAYGLTKPTAITFGDYGGDIRISLRALPERTLLITTFREGDGCRARAFTRIDGQPALLTSIYVEIGFLYSVDHIILHGLRVADGTPIQERIDD
jgi:hypothetical protein